MILCLYIYIYKLNVKNQIFKKKLSNIEQLNKKINEHWLNVNYSKINQVSTILTTK